MAAFRHKAAAVASAASARISAGAHKASAAVQDTAAAAASGVRRSVRAVGGAMGGTLYGAADQMQRASAAAGRTVAATTGAVWDGAAATFHTASSAASAARRAAAAATTPVSDLWSRTSARARRQYRRYMLLMRSLYHGLYANRKPLPPSATEAALSDYGGPAGLDTHTSSHTPSHTHTEPSQPVGVQFVEGAAVQAPVGQWRDDLSPPVAAEPTIVPSPSGSLPGHMSGPEADREVGKEGGARHLGVVARKAGAAIAGFKEKLAAGVQGVLRAAQERAVEAREAMPRVGGRYRVQRWRDDL